MDGRKKKIAQVTEKLKREKESVTEMRRAGGSEKKRTSDGKSECCLKVTLFNVIDFFTKYFRGLDHLFAI